MSSPNAGLSHMEPAVLFAVAEYVSMPMRPMEMCRTLLCNLFVCVYLCGRGERCSQPSLSPWACRRKCLKTSNMCARVCVCVNLQLWKQRERWGGQFHILDVCFYFLQQKRRVREVEERAERGRGRRNWNRNSSQWIKKQDSSFRLVVQPCIFPRPPPLSFSPSLSLCPAASPGWLICTQSEASYRDRENHA